ncbi:hypothetical protein [uncultured Devosia sp.]|uniref:hypothetical protein n=1 Tax=uncultured Devosia sp. TaxID=211434 RepID=UPI0035CA554C
MLRLSQLFIACCLLTLQGITQIVAAPMPVVASPVAGVDISGQWTSTVQGGTIYRLNLTQDGAGTVSGSYESGTISAGLLVGRDLYARWTQGGAGGTMLLRFSADGSVFAGIWARGDGAPEPANAAGTWDGYRGDRARSPANIDLSGNWVLDRGNGAVPLNLAVPFDATGFRGGYQPATGGQGSIHLAPQGSPAIATSFTDGNASGQGALLLGADNAHLTGYWHGADRSFGIWTLITASAAATEGRAATGGPGSEMPVPEQPQRQGYLDEDGVWHDTSPYPMPTRICPAPYLVTAMSTSLVDAAVKEQFKRLPAGTLLACKACDENYCAVVDDNPGALLWRQYLAFEYAPGASRPQPLRSSGAVPLGGDWLVDLGDGSQLDMNIEQAGDSVTGTYVERRRGLFGTVTGQLDGVGGLTLRIVEDPRSRDEPLTGTATTHMERDGSFAGDLVWAPNFLMPTTAYRSTLRAVPRAPAPPAPAAGPPAGFAGQYSVVSDRNNHYLFVLTAVGDSISGTFLDQGGTRGWLYGTAIGNTLVFHWTIEGGWTGDGNLTLSADGNALSGSYRGDIRSPITWDNYQGAWSGTRGAVNPLDQPAPDDRIDYGGCSSCNQPDRPSNPR